MVKVIKIVKSHHIYNQILIEAFIILTTNHFMLTTYETGHFLNNENMYKLVKTIKLQKKDKISNTINTIIL